MWRGIFLGQQAVELFQPFGELVEFGEHEGFMGREVRIGQQ
jgi:hypothetical protein